MIDILDKPLFRALLDGAIPFYDVMNSFVYQGHHR